MIFPTLKMLLLLNGKKPFDDYIKMSKIFFKVAHIIASEIDNDYGDNAKCDQWFFSAFYLYRQAIELLCKGVIISVVPRKNIASK